MTDLEANKRLVRDFFTALGAFDVVTMRALLTEDATWWVANTTGISGSYTRERFLGNVAAFAVDAVGPLTLTFNEDWTAEEDRVTCTAKGHLPLKDGKVYASDYSFMLRVRDGKIAGGKEYFDSAQLNALFFAVDQPEGGA